MTFKDGATTLGGGTLRNGTANISTSFLALGNHDITAVYSGSSTGVGFNSSTSPVLTQTVKAGTTTTLSASPANSSTYGQNVTFTATVTSSGGTPTGTVTFKDGAATLGTGTLSGGVATFSTSALAAGSHTISAVYSGSGNFNGSTSAGLTYSVNKAVLTFTADNKTKVYGEAVPALSYTVSDIAAFNSSVSGSPSVTTTATATSAPGTYPITITAGDLSSTNYSFVFANGILTINNGNTTTTVSSSLNPSTYGQSVTFTATVSSAQGTPAGTVTFKDGGATLGTGALSNGTATFATSTLSAGTHSIAASYGGYTGFNASTSADLTQVVNKAVLTFKADNKTKVYGAPVPALTYTVTGFVNGDDASVVSGNAVVDTTGKANSAPGTYAITVASGNGGNALRATNYTFTFVNGTLTVTKDDTTTTLVSSVNPSSYKQSVTFTATVTADAPGTRVANGTVQFYDGASPLGAPINTNLGQASYTTSTLSVDSHFIRAVYLGNANYTGSSSGDLTQVVNKAVLTFTADSKTKVYGAPVPDLTYTVTGFINGDTFASSVNDAPVLSTTATDTSAPGTYPIGISAGSLTSDNYSFVFVDGTLTINKADTTTVVSSSAIPSSFGQSVTYTATIAPVAPGAGTPTGTVQFQVDGVNAGSAVTVVNGKAEYSSSLAVGTHVIKAAYSGDDNFNGSTAADFTQTVQAATTTIDLVSSLNPSTFGQSVTFTATVTSAGATPDGTVRFFDGNSLLATVSLDANGVAAYSTSSLAAGTHLISAVYDGNTNYSTSISSNLTQVVDKAVLTFTADDKSKAYGAPVPALTYTVSGFVGSDTYSSSVTGAPDLSTTATATSAPGTYTITITAGTLSSANYSFVFVNGTLTINNGSTTTTITSSLNPSNFGQNVTFTATVAVRSPGAGTPTGTVTFQADGVNVGNAVTLVNGEASFSISTLSVGSHIIKAIFGGDANFNGSTNADYTQIVNPTDGTTTGSTTGSTTGTTTGSTTGTTTGSTTGSTTGGTTTGGTTTGGTTTGSMTGGGPARTGNPGVGLRILKEAKRMYEN